MTQDQSPRAGDGNEPEPAAWLVTWKGEKHTYVHAHASEVPAVDQARSMGGKCEPLYRAAPAAAPAWQPIETAPRDGTRFLGLNDGWHEFFHWQDGANERTKGWPTGWRTAITVYREGTGPTHWMPLPAAPEIPCAATGEQP